MENSNTFDFKKIEELYNNGEITKAGIESITWKLEFNKELKTEDEQGDLVTIIRTKNADGFDVIEYARRTTREENDAFAFTLVMGEEVDETQTIENQDDEENEVE